MYTYYYSEWKSNRISIALHLYGLWKNILCFYYSYRAGLTLVALILNNDQTIACLKKNKQNKWFPKIKDEREYLIHSFRLRMDVLLEVKKNYLRYCEVYLAIAVLSSTTQQRYL